MAVSRPSRHDELVQVPAKAGWVVQLWMQVHEQEVVLVTNGSLVDLEEDFR